jgi:hypothetical protein
VSLHDFVLECCYLIYMCHPDWQSPQRVATDSLGEMRAACKAHCCDLNQIKLKWPKPFLSAGGNFVQVTERPCFKRRRHNFKAH